MLASLPRSRSAAFVVIIFIALFILPIIYFPLLGQQRRAQRGTQPNPPVARTPQPSPTPTLQTKQNSVNNTASNSADGKKVLTNADIIRLTKSGLGDNVILNAIQGSEAKFDLTVDGLIQLKAAGVSQKVIESMQVAGSSGRNSAPTITTEIPKSTGTLTVATNKSIEQAAQPYLLYVNDTQNSILDASDPSFIQTKVKGDSLTTIAADDALSQIKSDIVVGAASRAIMAAPNVAGLPIIEVAGTMLSKLPGLRRDNKVTLLYALPRRQSSNILATSTPKFEIVFGDVVGANPDEFEPALIKIIPTNNNWRLAGAQKTNPKYFQSSEKIELTFVEEKVAVTLNKLSRGRFEITPQQPLAAGEYGIVLRPTSPTYKLSVKESLSKMGEGIIIAPIWDFSINGVQNASASSVQTIQTQSMGASTEAGPNKKLEADTPVAKQDSAKHSKDDEERLKNPPQMVINADVEKIHSVIIKGMFEAGYTLDKDDPHQLVFRKKTGGASGFTAGLLVGRDQTNPYQIITFLMTKQERGTLVLAKASILYPDKNNQGIPHDVDSKKIRKELYKNLDEIKGTAEK